MSVTFSKPAQVSSSWHELSNILKNGYSGTLVSIENPAELRSFLLSLMPVVERFPRLGMLYMSNPNRLLHAFGVELTGTAKINFDKARIQDSWIDAPAEYDKLLESPQPISNNLSLRTSESKSLFTIFKQVAMPKPGTPLREKVDCLNKFARQSKLVPFNGAIDENKLPPPVIVPSGESSSHNAAVNYRGVTDGWDVVMQVHDSFFKLVYDLFFNAEALKSGLSFQDKTIYLDHRYTFEGWLIKFNLFELSFFTTNPPSTIKPARQFVIFRKDNDTAGVKMQVRLKISNRWTTKDDWEVLDEYTATISRFGKITKQPSAQLSNSRMNNVFAADLLNGWNEIKLIYDVSGNDDARKAYLEIALDNYFRDEMPYLVLSSPFSSQEPFILWNRAACFTDYNASDMNAVTLCFGSKASSLGSSSDPFHNYILYHDKNIAIGISNDAIESSVFEALGAISLEGLTIKDFSVELCNGYIKVTADVSKKVIFSFSFKYAAEITLSIDKAGNLTGEIDEDSLHLPAALWFLSAIFLKLPGVVLAAVLKSIAKNKIGTLVNDRLDLNLAITSLFAGSFGDIMLKNSFDSVEINSQGVFIRGNLEI